MRGSQGGRHAIRGYLAQILISVMKTLREDNMWDEFEIESEKEDKVDLKYTFTDPKKDLVIQVKQSINEINDTNAKKWAEELKNDIPNALCELHLVSYTSKEVIKMKSHMDVSIILHLVNFQELRETANNRLNNYVVRLGYDRTNPKFISIVLKSLITDFFFWAINGKKISRKDFDDGLKSYMTFDKPDLIVRDKNGGNTDKEKKDHLKQEIIRSFKEGDFRSFYASIFDFGFKELTRILQWIIFESYDAYTDGVNKVQLEIDKGNRKDIKVGGITYVNSGSERYEIQFSPIHCQILFDVRQFSWFNKEGKPILTDGWDSQYGGSLMQMYFDHQTQNYGWHSFERPDIEDRSEEARTNILMYLKEKLNVN